jgi:polysaccharide export outer membrane protein
MRNACFFLVIALLALACAVAAVDPAYRLGPEDVVTVTVQRHPEFSGDFLVPPDGVVDLPAAGKTPAAGRSLAEFTGDVTTRLGKRLRTPEVTITLQAARMQRVYMLGAVGKPGVYDLKPGWRVTEALAAAGGLTKEAGECRAVLLRAASGLRESVALPEALRADPAANPLLAAGDVLTIDAVEQLPVYVTGLVKNPGLYAFRAGLGVAEALAQAGGLNQPADTVRVTVVRGGAILPADSLLQRGDVVRADPLRASSITVSGKVKTPGNYQIQEGDGLVQALTLAGGPLPEAAVSRVAVTRADGTTLTVNLIPALQDGKAEADVPLRAGDVVLVPEAVGRIAVLGFVNQPGYYALPDGKVLTLSDAIGLARGAENKRGGLSAVAVVSNVNGAQVRKIYNLQQFLKGGNLAQNPAVNAGDIVYVPETKKMNWEMVFQAIGALGAFVGPVL